MEDTSGSVMSSTPNSSRHGKSKQPVSGRLQCDACGKSFLSSTIMNRHQTFCLGKNAVDLKKTKAPKQKKALIQCCSCYSHFVTIKDWGDHIDICSQNCQIKRLQNKMKAVDLNECKSNAPRSKFSKPGSHEGRVEDSTPLWRKFPKLDDDEDTTPLWLQSGWYGEKARDLAEISLEMFNDLEGGKKYELVDPGPYGERYIPGGPIFHFNFKAKAQNSPNAQVETFFAQMRLHPDPVLDCCVSLGPSHELPGWESSEKCNGGCYYCRGVRIHHPTEKPVKLLYLTPGIEPNWLYSEV